MDGYASASAIQWKWICWIYLWIQSICTASSHTNKAPATKWHIQDLLPISIKNAKIPFPSSIFGFHPPHWLCFSLTLARPYITGRAMNMNRIFIKHIIVYDLRLLCGICLGRRHSHILQTICTPGWSHFDSMLNQILSIKIVYLNNIWI